MQCRGGRTSSCWRVIRGSWVFPEVETKRGENPRSQFESSRPKWAVRAAAALRSVGAADAAVKCVTFWARGNVEIGLGRRGGASGHERGKRVPPAAGGKKSRPPDCGGHRRPTDRSERVTRYRTARGYGALTTL